jgi:hypothetical protein
MRDSRGRVPKVDDPRLQEVLEIFASADEVTQRLLTRFFRLLKQLNGDKVVHALLADADVSFVTLRGKIDLLEEYVRRRTN